MFYIFGSTTDRQLVVSLKGRRPNLIFKRKGVDYDAEVFQLDKSTGHCFTVIDDTKYYMVAPDTPPQPNKIKPAIMEAEASAPEERRLAFMKFSKDDDSSTDYAVATTDNSFALVDHTKYEQCGVGEGKLCSPFYVSDAQVAAEVKHLDAESLQKIATKTYSSIRKNKTEWLESLKDAVDLTPHCQQVFLAQSFLAQVNRSCILFVPAKQDQTDTAAMLLLRSPGDADKAAKLAQLLEVEPEYLGNSGDETAGGVILGRVGSKTVGVCALGLARENANLLQAAVAQAAPKNVIVDASSLQLDDEGMAAFVDHFKDKQFCIILSRSTPVNEWEKTSALTNAEIVRHTPSVSIASRINGGMTCVVVHGCGDNAVITETPFSKCSKTNAALLSPLLSYSLLDPSNWEPVE